MNKDSLPVLFVPPSANILPDNDQWQHRMEIRSETSNRIYVVSQNKKNLHWGCSCPGWKAHRKCKHLSAVGVPNHEVPYEVKLES